MSNIGILINSKIMFSSQMSRIVSIRVNTSRCIRFSFNNLQVLGQITHNDHRQLPTEPCNSSRSLDLHLNKHHLYPYRRSNNIPVNTKHPNHKSIGLQTLPNQPLLNSILIHMLPHLINHRYLHDLNHPRPLGPLDPRHLLKQRR